MTEKTDRRKSPENIERLKRQGFQKGNPPPKGSGRKKLPEELKHAVVNATPDALEMMIDMMHNSPNEQVRYKAAEWILSSVIPKAKADSNVNVNHNHSIAGMLAEINSLKLPGAKERMIDITPEVDTDDDD